MPKEPALRTVLCAILTGLLAAPAAAQQGSLQVSAAAQATTGESARDINLGAFEPDLGVTWFQPGTRFGTLQLEVRGTERQNEPHFGRIYGSLRDLKAGGFRWTVDAGDTYYAPTIGKYRFSNLTTPAVTFSGAAVGARSARTDVGFVAGEATVWRNIFGSDPDSLDQTIVAGRGAHHANDRLDVSARGSRIRTSDLDEFSYSIAASDQAGGGVRYAVTPSIQMIADGSVVWYRRVGSTARERDGSGLVGYALAAQPRLAAGQCVALLAGGVADAQFPAARSRRSVRGRRVRSAQAPARLRRVGGVPIEPRSERGAGRRLPGPAQQRPPAIRRCARAGRRPIDADAPGRGRRSHLEIRHRPAGIESDTGVWSADWQAAVGRMNGFLRVAQRNNVTSASRAGSYEQRDVAGQFFLRLSQSAQLFRPGDRNPHDRRSGRRQHVLAGGRQLANCRSSARASGCEQRQR